MEEAELKRVAALYDSPEGQVGQTLFGGHMHWGYWKPDRPQARLAEAAENMSQVMMEKTEIRPGQRFVDLGCGPGLAAIELAEARGCEVDGITISKVQQLSAIETAKARGVDGRVRFFHGSALEMPCEDGRYDGGWFFESIFHMGHREALREASRILKPGALLTLTDLPVLPTATSDFRRFVLQRIRSSFVAKEDYPHLFKEAGFDLIKIDDITDNVMPMLASKMQEAIDDNIDHIREIMPDVTKERMIQWVHLHRVMSENLSYVIVAARKR